MSLAKRPQLNVESLDERIVPATLVDLTASDASATVNAGLVRQVDAPASPWLRGWGGGWGWGYWRSWGRVDPEFGRLDTFLSIDRNGVEQGYNSDARRASFDENVGNTHAIRLNEVSRVNINGVAYREFLLNVNQSSRSQFISLDEVKIYVGNSASPSVATLNSMTPVWSMDAGGDATIRLNDNLNRNSRTPDMVLLVPESAFAGANSRSFVTLYSKFSGANEGAEEWSVRRNVVIQAPPVSPPPTSPPTSPPPSSGPASISGRLYFDVDANGEFTDADTPLHASYTIMVTGEDGDSNLLFDDYTITTNSDGTFALTGLAPGKYSFTIFDGSGEGSYSSITGLPGTSNQSTEGDDWSSNSLFNIKLEAGETATGYGFLLG